MKCKCYICGKEFNRKPASIRRAKHPTCSNECREKLKVKGMVKVKCCVCGKEMERRASRLAIRPNPVCSKECRAILNHNIHYDDSIPNEIRQTDRNLIPQNRVFINSVMERDDYTCQVCHSKGGDLAVHHLNGYNWDVDNRYNPDNGVTLCERCHREFHTMFGYGNNTKEQFNEYANPNRRLGLKA